jgi:glycosyltransferase involved in cell wall biosynthesis
MSKPDIWLLSAYRADSHVAWADWLVTNFPQVEWHRLELPGRHFRWRIRGNPLSWLDKLPDTQPDLIIATSMVDLATIKGLHPRLANVPAYYYFHENQFAYPVSEHQASSIEPQMVQLYGALAAQRVLFNSNYNRDTFLDGVDNLLQQMPDAIPDGVRQKLQNKCEIFPVPFDPIAPAPEKDKGLIIWNHRWEYDKAPDLFANAMLELTERGIDFRLALLGARPQQVPEPLALLREKLKDRIIADDKVDTNTYRHLLGTASIVVSTSLHEFQGLSIMEAASAGVRPIVPDALCYPQQYTEQYRYPAGDQKALVKRLEQWLTNELPPVTDASAFYTSNLYNDWQELLNI